MRFSQYLSETTKATDCESVILIANGQVGVVFLVPVLCLAARHLLVGPVPIVLVGLSPVVDHGRHIGVPVLGESVRSD